jgi:hypothetical protein
MKKVSMKLTVSVLILAMIPLSAFSAQKVSAGAPCTKLNSKATANNKTFTCIKKGKKLVWNNGVVNKVAAPSVTPTPSASPTPTPTVTPTPSASPTPTPTPTPTYRYAAGDTCEKTGQRESSPEGYLECREVANKNKKFFQLSQTPKAPPTNVSPENLDVCRIPDQSTTDRTLGPAIAYPIPSGELFARIPKTGQINALIIPIDFPDSPGKGSPKDLYEEMILNVNAWMKWYSNGKNFYKFQTYDKWIRAPKETTSYLPNTTTSGIPNDAVGFKPGPQRDKFDIASEYLDLAEKYFDYKGAHSIFFLYPKDVKIWSEFWGLGINYPSRGWYTTYDSRLFNVWIHSSSGRQAYYQFPVWAFFLHENLHNQGLQGHAPNQGSNLGIMTNQYGLSLPLTSWDTLIIDWQIENQFYCVQREKITPTTLVMSPMEREEIGTKAIMIKLSNTQVLVIESRRKDKWSSGSRLYPGLPDGFYGVIVYKVDTTAKPLYGIMEPDGPNWQDSSDAYAYLIRNLNVDHGYTPGAPQSGPIDMNFVMYEGESLTTNGIKISLVKSGDHDEVKIERA